MKDPFVIVWDLDGTLGDFTALHQQGERTQPIQVRLRPGLAAALRLLSEAGFVHTVLTLATPLYAEMVLRGTGLREFFVRVEGLGQRGKGDAQGIGDALGVPAGERPHRMLFVGDHPLFDEPHDPRVVFHLELCGLSRPAADLARLVLHLRQAGGGSLRRGFDRLGQGPWWKRLWPDRGDGLLRCFVPAVGELVLMARPDGCPVIGFEKPPAPAAEPSEHRFVPAEVLAQTREG